MHLHLITAEDALTLATRRHELIRFPQLTMPYLAALTPPSWSVTHTDEITHAVDTRQSYDLVGITAATPGAPHAYELAHAFRVRGVPVAMGGPQASLLPYEVAEHADIVVVGEAERQWARVLADVERAVRYEPGTTIIDPSLGASVERLPNGSKIYRCPHPADLTGLPHARRDLIRSGGWNKWWATRGAMIATRGCPHRCDYCAIPLLYPQPGHMRYRPVREVAAEIAQVPDKGIAFWDDNLGANRAYARDLLRALIPLHNEWVRTQFYSPGHVLRRLLASHTGLWWNLPRNVGYTLGLTGEDRARAAVHDEYERGHSRRAQTIS